MMVGALVGAVSGGHSETDGAFLEPLDASRIARGALAGAAVGATSGALAGDKVVFEADEHDLEPAR